jgi:hypothetical protein
MFSNFFKRKSCLLSDNVEKRCRAGEVADNSVTRRVRFAYWVSEATNTHSEYVLLIAFPRQQLHERSSVSRCSTLPVCRASVESILIQLWCVLVTVWCVLVTVTC